MAIGLAGGLGTIARYGLTCGANAVFGPHYPWGTFFVNIIGCFMFGIVSGLLTAELFSSHWRVVFLSVLYQ